MKRYSKLNTLRSEEEKLYRSNPIYPTVPPSADDYYIISTVGDRYDTLASKFYRDPKLWWIIASANKFNSASLVLEPGVQIRIPYSKEQAIELYNQINSTR